MRKGGLKCQESIRMCVHMFVVAYGSLGAYKWPNDRRISASLRSHDKSQRSLPGWSDNAKKRQSRKRLRSYMTSQKVTEPVAVGHFGSRSNQVRGIS